MVRAGDAAASGAVGVGVGLEGEVGVEGEVGGGVDGAVGVGLWGGAVTASAAAACSSMSACGWSSAMRSFARCTHFCSVGRFSFSRYCRYAATAPRAWPDWRSDSARP